MRDTDSIDRLFQALADPHRRSLVERLARAPASVSDLAAPADLQLPAVLKHLQVLERSGLVMSEKRGRVRTYRMAPDALEPARFWIDERRRDMHRAFDRLAALMAATPERKDH